jgi:aspartyl-tRNA(Asn)/glutamyl-tRNA(Gln) amidotransferase subunit A
VSALQLRALHEIAADVGAGRSTAEAHLAAAFAALRDRERGETAIHAFLAIDEEAALDRARAIDALPADRRRMLPLAGVPVAVKDNIATLDLPTTCGSRMLEGYRSPFEATAVRRLREAGAVIVGKTNLDEFAMGSSTENSAYGPTRNPIDLERVPGGSSGGSAAAVAGGVVPTALGSETGGSVRQPAAFCGIVGIKPSYGRVSRYGLVAFASSLDHIGTFGRTVEDAALVLQVIGGPDARDSTCAPEPVPDLVTAARGPAGPLVVGVPAEYFARDVGAGVADACRAALDRLARTGVEVREVSLPHTDAAIPTYYVIAPAEASSNLARYDGVRYGVRAAAAHAAQAFYERTRTVGFGEEVKRRIVLGTFVLSAGYHDQYYGRAQRVRGLIAQDFRAVFESGIDVLFTPTTPTPAFRLGEKTDDPYAMYLSDIFTVTANLAGLPALSLPIGTVAGLPVGGQLIADRWQEATLVRAAAALERELAR